MINTIDPTLNPSLTLSHPFKFICLWALLLSGCNTSQILQNKKTKNEAYSKVVMIKGSFYSHDHDPGSFTPCSSIALNTTIDNIVKRQETKSDQKGQFSAKFQIKSLDQEIEVKTPSFRTLIIPVKIIPEDLCLYLEKTPLFNGPNWPVYDSSTPEDIVEKMNKQFLKMYLKSEEHKLIMDEIKEYSRSTNIGMILKFDCVDDDCFTMKLVPKK